MALLEVATYQVPETMEWEQQNQGLGKSPLTNPFQRFHYLLLASVREKNNLLMVMYAFIGILLGISSSTAHHHSGYWMFGEDRHFLIPHRKPSKWE